MARRPRKGQVLVYYGEGKGKTTAALGLALRAVGRALARLHAQFTVGEWPPRACRESAAASRLAPGTRLIPTGIGFVNILGDPYLLEAHQEAAEKGGAGPRKAGLTPMTP